MKVEKDPAIDLIIGSAGLKGMNIPELALKTRIPKRTMHSRLESPSTMRLTELCRIVWATSMTDEQIVKLVRGGRK